MAYTIRPCRPDDAASVAALTLAAIRVTGLRAYSPAQVAAWSAGFSTAYLAERLLDGAHQGDVVLIAADLADTPAAYAELQADGHLAMLYCHPEHTGRGLALRLLGAAEDAARARGTARLFAEASELARPVFARAGYTLLHRCDFAIGPDDAPVAIHNYAMEKRLC